MIGTIDKEVFRAFEGMWEDFLKEKDNLIINPIYNIKQQKNQVILEIKPRIEMFKKENLLSGKYLSERLILEEELSQFVKGRILKAELIPDGDMSNIEHLMRKFVIINAPKGYSGK